MNVLIANIYNMRKEFVSAYSVSSLTYRAFEISNLLRKRFSKQIVASVKINFKVSV